MYFLNIHHIKVAFYGSITDLFGRLSHLQYNIKAIHQNFMTFIGFLVEQKIPISVAKQFQYIRRANCRSFAIQSIP